MRIDFVPNFSVLAINLMTVGVAFGALATLSGLFLGGLRFRLNPFGALILLVGIGLLATVAIYLPHQHEANRAAYRHNVTALNTAVAKTYGIYLTKTQADTLIGDSDRVAYGEPTVFMNVEGRKAIVGLHQEQGKWYLMSNAQDLLHVKG